MAKIEKTVSEANLVQRVAEQLRQCHGFDGDKASTDRLSALNYYFQRPRGDEIPGASRVVSGDLSAQVEACLAQMMDAFSGDAVAEFHPVGEGDDDQAALESDVVNYFLMKQSNGWMQFAQAIKDALLLRNGVLKVWVDTRVESHRRKFSGVTQEAIPTLLSQAPRDVVIEPGIFDEAAGTLETRLVKTVRTFRAEAIPLENFLYLDSWDSHELGDIPFCAERHIDSRSALIEMGYDKAKVQSIPAYHRAWTIGDMGRSPGGELAHRVGMDSSQDLIEWYECYALIDHDGDGISERRMVAVAGPVLLENEPASRVPYAGGCAIINPHRFMGVSLYDKLRQVQDVSTGLQRGLLDNVTATNKPRIAYLDGAVNVDDLDNGRPNGSVRVRKSVGEVSRAITAIMIPDMSGGILQNLEYQRGIRSELGGAALDLATGTMQLNDRLGSQGLDRAYSVMEQLSSLMTRTVASTLMRSAYLLAHATLRENYNAPVEVRQSGRWISAIPSEWPERKCVTIKVGMSPGERARRAQSLEKISNMQMGLATQGMDEVLVNLERFHRLAIDWARSMDVPLPEQYFVDPRSPESQQARQSKQQSAQAAQATQQAFMQQAVELEQIRTMLGKYIQDTDLQFKYWSAILEAETEEAKIVGAATTELLKASEAPPPMGAVNGSDNGRPKPVEKSVTR